jgi:hypothetical protein
MTTTHTPGPWRIVGGTEVRGADGTIVCNTADYRVPKPDMVAVALPDAALVAAAPALLAALQALLAKHDDRDGLSDLWPEQAAAARAAIKAATGA